jgi:hypothetical protein
MCVKLISWYPNCLQPALGGGVHALPCSLVYVHLFRKLVLITVIRLLFRLVLWRDCEDWSDEPAKSLAASSSHNTGNAPVAVVNLGLRTKQCLLSRPVG